jgi:hypothetical protein
VQYCVLVFHAPTSLVSCQYKTHQT